MVCFARQFAPFYDVIWPILELIEYQEVGFFLPLFGLLKWWLAHRVCKPISINEPPLGNNRGGVFIYVWATKKVRSSAPFS